MASVRNAAIALADQVKRLQQSQARLKRAVDAGRAAGLSEDDVHRAVQLATAGRPDRARALELYAKAGQP